MTRWTAARTSSASDRTPVGCAGVARPVHGLASRAGLGRFPLPCQRSSVELQYHAARLYGFNSASDLAPRSQGTLGLDRRDKGHDVRLLLVKLRLIDHHISSEH